MKSLFLKLSIILTIFFTLNSCKKENNLLTSGQIISTELKEVIKKNNIIYVQCRKISGDGKLIYWDGSKDFEVLDELIRVDDDWYNLNYLISFYTFPYSDSETSDGKQLVIKFE